MAYALYTQSYGVSNANKEVQIRETATGLPVILLTSATGGLLNDQGIAALDSGGNLSVYLDTDKTVSVTFTDTAPTIGPTGLLNSTQVFNGVTGVIGEAPLGRPVSGTGNQAAVPWVLGQAVDVAGTRTVTGSTSEVSLYQLSVPAGVMGPSGALRITGWCSHTNGASLKTLRIKFGAMVLSHAPTTNVSEQWSIWIRNVATNSQRAHASVASSMGATGSAVVTGSVDTTAAVLLEITGQLAVGGDFLTLEGVTVELIRPYS